MIDEIIKYHEEAAKNASKRKAQGLSFEERSAVYFHERVILELMKIKNLMGNK